MLFDNVIEQIQASKKEEAEVVIVKLGEVTSVTPGGRAYVKLYGDGSPSTKLYTYIDGYFPEQGDKVALLPQGKTYIILGKVNDENPVEIYAKIQWVKDNFLGLEYKSIIEDANDATEKIRFENYALIPTSDNKDTLGGADNNFKEIFIKKLTLDGESFTKIYQDRIFVKDGNNIYSLIATYSGGAVTLTPSADNQWKLGTSAAQLAEVWAKLFRGSWKSGQTTERALSWDSNNALVPDSNNTVDLGSSSAAFKNLFLAALIGAKWQYNSGAAYNLAWSSASDLLPSADNQINLGSASKMFASVRAKKIYLDGVEMSTTTAVLTVTSGNNTRTLTLTYTANGADLLPNVNNTFKLGSASYKFAEIFATKFTGDLTGNVTGNVTGDITGKYKDGTSYYLQFDSSHNLVPDTNNVLSLGTSSLKYKDIYAAIFHGLLDGGIKDGSFDISFDSSHNLVPSSTNTLSLGTSSKQFEKVYAKELYMNGVLIDVSGITTNQLKDGTNTLTLSTSGTDALILPNVNNKFYLGSNSYKLAEVVATLFTGDLDGKIKDGSYDIGFDNNHNYVPSAANTINLGAATKQYNKVYAKEFYMDGVLIDLTQTSTAKLKAVNGSYTREIELFANNQGANLLPATANQYNIGSYQYYFKELFASYFCGALRNYTSQSSYQSIEWDNLHNFYPSTTNTISLGTQSKQFKNVYGQNLYVNGTAVSSDARKKEDISPLDWRYKEFFKNLKPVAYKFKDGTSGRKHTGFLAQEVEEAVTKAGLTDKDLAVVVRDPEDNYYLRYEEIIAVQTEVIHELMAKVETLESEKKFMESKMNKLESRLKKIEQFLFEQ